MAYRRPPHLLPEAYKGGQRIFFTLCTFDRHRCFEDTDVVAFVREQLLTVVARREVEVIAYCFMPDHLHALATGRTESADVKKAIDVFRRQSAYHYKRRWCRRLWQDGYFDRVLRSEESTPSVVRYIVANPVREGLVREPGDYAFLGSSDHSLEELLVFIEASALG
jgi:REP element-mobilizing transposase RayT